MADAEEQMDAALLQVPQDSQQAQAIEGARARCAGLVESDFQLQAPLEQRRDDPLVRSGLAFMSARDAFSRPTEDPGPLRQALEGVLEVQDPLLLDSLGLLLVAYRDPSTGRAAYFFQGRKFGPEGSPDLGFAIQLLPCELGMACDGTEPRAQLQCALGAQCGGGRYKEVESALRDRPGEYARVAAMAKLMADAVRRRDVEAFIPRH